MAKSFAHNFYNSDRWHSCRDAYISERMSIDGGLCEICHEEPGYIVHHKVNLTIENINDPMIALNPDLLEFVCKDCHDWEPGHFYDSHNIRRPRCRFDASGNPIER